MGYSVRTRGANLTEGPVRVIQPRSLEAGPRINLDNTDYTNPVDIDPRHLLLNNDLIFRTRGSRFEATMYQNDGVATVAASPLVVIRVTHPTLQAGFLAWFLNNDPGTRRQVDRNAANHTIPSLAGRTIAEIAVPVPPVETQNLVLEAAALGARQQEILRRLLELNEKHFNAALGQSVRRWNKE
ncbi:MAG: hypothetical protein IPK87_00900 [Planctomycetes bacterium]|nr:hypothetical protein [Planctomycetota bacterium]